VLTDSTWRWVLSPVDYSEFHKRFWRQLVLYLAKREVIEGKKVWIEMDARNFPAGRSAVARLYVDEEGPDKARPVQIKAIADSRDGASLPVQFLAEGDFFGADLRELPAGDYGMIARVSRQGSKIGEAETRFIVNESTLEYDRIGPDVQALDRLAKATGGSRFDASRFRELLGQLSAVKGVYKYSREVTKSLWNAFWVFFVFTTSLSLEWALRRRWGMA